MGRELSRMVKAGLIVRRDGPPFSSLMKCPAGIPGNLHKLEIGLLSCFPFIILGFIYKLN
jgi:hypothetical protein